MIRDNITYISFKLKNLDSGDIYYFLVNKYSKDKLNLYDYIINNVNKEDCTITLYQVEKKLRNGKLFIQTFNTNKYVQFDFMKKNRFKILEIEVNKKRVDDICGFFSDIEQDSTDIRDFETLLKEMQNEKNLKKPLSIYVDDIFLLYGGYMYNLHMIRDKGEYEIDNYRTFFDIYRSQLRYDIKYYNSNIDGIVKELMGIWYNYYKNIPIKSYNEDSIVPINELDSGYYYFTTFNFKFKYCGELECDGKKYGEWYGVDRFYVEHNSDRLYLKNDKNSIEIDIDSLEFDNSFHKSKRSAINYINKIYKEIDSNIKKIILNVS